MPLIINGNNTPTAGGVGYGNGTELAFTGAGSAGNLLVSSGSGAPTWSSAGTVAVTSVSFGSTGLTPATPTAGAVVVSGVLNPANGGTGLSSLGTGIATWLGTPSSANLAAAVTDETGTGALVFANTPTLVAPLLGTPTSGNFSTGTFTWPTFNQNTTGTAAGLSTTLVATSGGTGQSSYAVGDLLYASTTTALSKLADVATGNALISGGVGVAPSWGKIGLATHVSGTLPVANGGTGLTSGTSGGVLYYSAAGTLASSGALTSNALVVGGGAGVAPSTITTGTGVVTALGINTGTAGAFVVNGGALGTPSSGTLTSCAGLPLTTGVTGVLSVANGGTNASTASITSFNNITGYTATGATGTTSTNLVFSGSPTIATPTITTSATTPLVIGGTGTTSALALRSTSGVGTTGADITFQTGNNGATEAMRILNSGNVGIGSSSPAYKLDVAGTGNFGGLLTAASLSSTGNATVGGTLGVTGKLDVNGGALGSTPGSQNITQRLITTTSNVDYLEMSSIRVSTGSDWTSAGWRLQQKVDTTLMGYMQFNGGNNAGVSFGTGMSSTSLGVQERMRIDSTGNVGIGTTSPDALLTVNTIASFGDGAVGTPSIAHKGDLNTGFWFPAADTIAASTAGSERMRLDANGNLGVGTSFPNSAPGYTFLTVQNNVGGGIVEAKDLSVSLRMQTQGDGGGYIGTYSNHPLIFFSNTAERLRIDTSGNLGIGTASNLSTLTVNGSFASKSPSTVNAATYTVAATDGSLRFTTTNCTVTLPAAASFPGRILYLNTITANSVTSAASNVIPLGSNTAGTAIFAATAGKFAMIQSDGTNWITMMAN